MQKSPLLHHKTIKKQRENVELTDKQIVASKKWLGYLDADELEVEKENYLIFRDTILRDILGFPEDNIGFEVDNVEFSLFKRLFSSTIFSLRRLLSTTFLFLPSSILSPCYYINLSI